ncbi:MAG: hypothetical protein GY757_48660, partial [bacterium]|nr:hypothetical protein [bacterium]
MNHRHNFLIIFGCIFVLVLGLFSLSANDGRDRYAGAYSNTLYLFPDAPVFQSGYRLLKKDEPGGADGTRAFRWGQPQAIALVRVAAHKTQETLGKGKFPMPIFDFSSENGDTPVDFVTGKPPRGRHPGGSHDGGINLDLGYYLTSLKGLQYTPDHSACTNHFDSRDKNAKDAYICKGPADRLDVPRQTFFMLQLFKINRELFHSNLLEQIGMDWKIQIAVMKKLEEWLLDNKYGVTLEHIKDMRELCTADSFEGWAYSHHHHIHLRLCDISVFGKYRDAFLKLLEAERQLDYQLLLANTKKGTTLLRVRLQSYAMNRAVEVELMDKVSIKTGVRFRLDGGEWVAADPASWSRKKAFLECPLNLQKNEKLVKVEVEITP